MKRNIFFMLLACTLLYACKKDTKLLYNSPDNIYLDYPTTDTITYSFAYSVGLAQDTVWIPVKISGKRISQDRNFEMNIIANATTATQGLHYEALKSSYKMPADSGVVHVPVILKNTDAALESKSVYLTLRVTGGSDFQIQLADSLRTKTLLFSNRLEKPDWWNIKWADQIGDYSRVKHQLFLITSGTRDLINLFYGDPNFQIPRNLYYIENTRTFLKDPFTWVTNHPDKGYMLTKITGSEDYNFYNVASPDKKFLFKYFSNNQYFFIDENGGQIKF
ncbi:hypothetical protein GCM10023149_06970 [Mucilaginibacter gynuensis]|uniref:DUF4843 domain-containing protein n=1 Tax=Mucilaginibacter gynuensis TaxID=1302236 RepID=A0ABP8FVL4_9SPHI